MYSRVTCSTVNFSVCECMSYIPVLYRTLSTIYVYFIPMLVLLKIYQVSSTFSIEANVDVMLERKRTLTRGVDGHTYT